MAASRAFPGLVRLPGRAERFIEPGTGEIYSRRAAEKFRGRPLPPERPETIRARRQRRAERRVQQRAERRLGRRLGGTVELRKRTADMRFGGRLLGRREWWLIQGTGDYANALHLAPWADIQARIVQYTAGHKGRIRMVAHAWWLEESSSPSGAGWRSSTPMEARQMRAAALQSGSLDEFLGRLYSSPWADVYDLSFDEVKR